MEKILKLKEKINIKTLLYLYIIISPILDCMSFIFRNTMETKISPSTVIRPIFILIACLYIFISDKKQRKIFILAGVTYAIYSIVHIYIFQTVKNGSSYSGMIHELQYLVNYTFMVLSLYTFIYVFSKEKNNDTLLKCILISISIYILSIYLAIITGTSSHTYLEEKIGLKGWFESGNSLSAILILSLFILTGIFGEKTINKKTKTWTSIVIIFIGIFLMTLIGTRVGLYGFCLVIGLSGITQVIYNLIHKNKVKETLIITGTIAVIGIVAIIALINVVGSTTLDRRQKVKEMANEVVDETSNETIHITGDLAEIKKQIEEKMLEEGFMSEAQQKAVIKLDEIATAKNLSVEQMRTLQLIYNTQLMKYQANPIYILFGNGYVSQYFEMILEMEFVAILINFGIYGFILYLMPFLIIYGYSVYRAIKNIREADVGEIMLLFGGGMAFALSFLSGYIFFNASTTMIIILINTLLITKKCESK